MAQEKELSGMHQLLEDQDDDLRACQHRLGDLESTLLLACTGGNALFAEGPASTPLHPIRRTLYDNATAVDEEHVDKGIESTTAFGDSTLPAEQSQDPCIASVPLPLPPGTPSPMMPSRPQDESSQQWTAVGTPSRHVGTHPQTSESSRPQRDPQRERVAESPGSTSLSTPIEEADTAVTVSRERWREIDVAPKPRPIPVTSPSALPSRPAAYPVLAVCSGGPPAIFAASRPARSLDLSSSHGESSPQPLKCRNEAQSTPPERPGVGKARATGGGRERPVLGLDSYGRCLDRSFQALQDQRRSLERNEEAGVIADVAAAKNDVDPPARERGCRQIGEDDADRLARAERRAGIAEAAERATDTGMLPVVRGAAVARDEAEELRREVIELSRWREAVLDLRDVLNVAQKRDRGRGNESDRDEETTDDDPVKRHAEWASSSALETLLPHLHQSARELLSDLASAREQVETLSAAAIAEDSAKPGVVTVTRRKCGMCAWAAESGEREHVKESNCSDGRDVIRESILQVERERKGNESSVTRTDSGDTWSKRSNGSREVGSLSMSGAAGHGADANEVNMLRKGCETLRIMVDALRQKDGESQKRIFALEQQVLDASLAAVRQEALVSTLRRQLESRDSTAQSGPELNAAGSVPPEQGNDPSLRGSQCGQGSRLRHEMSLSAAQASPPVSTPRQVPWTNEAYRTESPGATGGCPCDRSSPVAATPTAGSSFCDRRGDEDSSRTPTTDILRRLLYENTPKSSSTNTSEPDGKSGVDGNDYGSARERTRHGRRLFAEGSTVLRACPTASCDVGGVRRGPGVLFSDPACGTDAGSYEAWRSRRMVVEDEQGSKDKISRVGCLRKPTTQEATAVNGRPGERGGVSLATGEVFLRERLLRARRDFSALHTEHQTDEMA